MTMVLVSRGDDPNLPRRKKREIPAKQLGGVESPATVLLYPIHFNGGAEWWSHDGVLLGGIKINGTEEIKGKKSDVILYLPTPVPRSWAERVFGVVVEYECEEKGAIFQLKLHYGCGDPSELHKGESDLFAGETGAKKRHKFRLNKAHIKKNELFRATLEIVRVSPKPVLIYGVWLEVGV